MATVHNEQGRSDSPGLSCPVIGDDHDVRRDRRRRALRDCQPRAGSVSRSRPLPRVRHPATQTVEVRARTCGRRRRLPCAGPMPRRQRSSPPASVAVLRRRRSRWRHPTTCRSTPTSPSDERRSLRDGVAAAPRSPRRARETSVPARLSSAETERDDDHRSPMFLGRAVSSPARAATSFFADTPFSGQVNLLTDELVRHAGGAVVRHRSARHGHCLPERRRTRRRSRGLDRARRAHRSRHCVVERGRLLQDSRCGATSRTTSACRTAHSATAVAIRSPCASVRDGTRNAGTVYGFDTFTVTPACGGHVRRQLRAL